MKIDGLNKTKASVVERTMNLKTGAPVNEVQWLQARRRLYDQGLFRRIDMEPVPVGAAQPDPATGVLANRSKRRYRWRSCRSTVCATASSLPTSLSSTAVGREFGPGLVVELRRNILFGRAISAGIAGRYEQTTRSAGSS